MINGGQRTGVSLSEAPRASESAAAIMSAA
jgi:hypothetical protein